MGKKYHRDQEKYLLPEGLPAVEFSLVFYSF